MRLKFLSSNRISSIVGCRVKIASVYSKQGVSTLRRDIKMLFRERYAACQLATVLIVISMGLLSPPAKSQPSKSFKNEVTGQDCIQPADGPQDSLPRFRKLHFKNTCRGTFVVTLVLANGKKTSSGGVEAGKTIVLLCDTTRDECTGIEYEVR